MTGGNIINFRVMRDKLCARIVDTGVHGKAVGLAGFGWSDECSGTMPASWSYRYEDDFFLWRDDDDTIRFLMTVKDDDKIIALENRLIQLVTGKKKRF